LFSNASTAIATTNILILIPALGEYRGLSKGQYSTVYLIISLCDMIARLTGSFISDRGLISPKIIFACGLCFAGISSSLIAFLDSFSTLSVACAVFGFASGFHIGIYGTLLTEIVGIELLHVGYALTMILNG
jgi:MFS family permease